ncbi:MAG: cyclic nucleotide-binding domain-containing protein [Anaerolineales bacterium]|nr:cyclic nucleotide-binding domain-containing protein [Anaerolineales bacterium]
MTSDSSQTISFLQDVALFHPLNEEELGRVARRLKEFQLEKGQVLFAQGDVGDNFYIIRSGKVSIWVKHNDERRELATLEQGDFFGEKSLLYNRRRSSTVEAVEGTTLLYLERNDFNWLIKKYPLLDHHLKATARAFEEILRRGFDWLHDGEVVYLLERRHPFQLLVDLSRPALILIPVVFFAFIGYLHLTDAATLITYVFAGVLFTFFLLWSIWELLDYLNDYYIVTNQRVIWLEQVILQSASQQDTPLTTIQSVNIQTSWFGRLLNYGDLVIRTYTASMNLTDVPDPVVMKDLIEDLAVRVRHKSSRAKEEAMRQAIRHSLGLSEEAASADLTEFLPDMPSETRGSRIIGMRTVRDGTITYHKHWLFLLLKIGMPTLVMFLLLLSIFLLGIYGVLNWLTLVLVGFLGLLVPVGWFIYQFADWKNDIYQLTPDSIIDSERKPLGKEITNSAPVNNILSLRNNRPNLLAILFNYGNVDINVGDETFVFRHVHDPARIQSEIVLRMEKIKFEEEETQASRERERMAEWMKAYSEVRSEMENPPQTKEAEPPES